MILITGVKIKFRIKTKKMKSIQLYSFPQNRFYVLESSHRPPASVGINFLDSLNYYFRSFLLIFLSCYLKRFVEFTTESQWVSCSGMFPETINPDLIPISSRSFPADSKSPIPLIWLISLLIANYFKRIISYMINLFLSLWHNFDLQIRVLKTWVAVSC